jgi:hypothetical protein
MRKTPLLVSAALASLAGCAYEPVTPVPVVAAPAVVAPATTVVTTTPAPAVVAVPQAVVAPQAVVTPVVVATGVRPGLGRVESNNAMPQVVGEARPMRRVGLRMDDGTVQFVDTRAQNLAVGDRVELTADSHIRYPLPR